MENFGLFVTLWVASGAFVGGVMTPLVTQSKQVSDWIAMLLGMTVGSIGNVLVLVPLWGFLAVQADHRAAGSAWRRDDRMAGGMAVPADALGMADILAMLKTNFWPKPAAHGVSHRREYVAVFVALAVITAVEVALTVIGGSWITGPLVMLSTVKVLLVAGFFMHLRYDSRWYTAIFAFALPFAALMVIILALA